MSKLELYESELSKVKNSIQNASSSELSILFDKQQQLIGKISELYLHLQQEVDMHAGSK